MEGIFGQRRISSADQKAWWLSCAFCVPSTSAAPVRRYDLGDGMRQAWCVRGGSGNDTRALWELTLDRLVRGGGRGIREVFRGRSHAWLRPTTNSELQACKLKAVQTYLANLLTVELYSWVRS